MDLNKFRKKIVFDSLVLIAVTSFLTLLNVFFFMKEKSDSETLSKFKSDIERAKQEFNETKTNLNIAGELIDKYAALPAILLARPSSEKDDVVDRIRSARKLLEDLKNKYRLTSLDLSVTPPKTMEEAKYKIGDFVASGSVVTLKFSGISDEVLLSFLHDLIDGLDGYTVLTSLTIEQVGPIIKDTIANARKGVAPELVKAVAVFDWVKLYSDKVKLENQGKPVNAN